MLEINQVEGFPEASFHAERAPRGSSATNLDARPWGYSTNSCQTIIHDSTWYLYTYKSTDIGASKTAHNPLAALPKLSRPCVSVWFCIFAFRNPGSLLIGGLIPGRL